MHTIVYKSREDKEEDKEEDKKEEKDKEKRDRSKKLLSLFFSLIIYLFLLIKNYYFFLNSVIMEDTNFWISIASRTSMLPSSFTSAVYFCVSSKLALSVA